MEQGNLWNQAQAHTQWKNNLFLQHIVTLHLLTRTTSSTVRSTRRTLTSKFQECQIRQWNDHMASTFKTWFRRSRTTLSDEHFKVIFNNIDHSTISAKNHKTWLEAAESTELCERLDVELKAQCKACLAYWDPGIVYCTCGHFLRDDTTENKKYIKSVLDLFSIPNFYIRKGRPHGHRYGKKEGDQEYHTANQLQKKCKKRQFLSIHDRFIRDTWFRKTMLELGRTEEVIREMDKLANEDHTHIATEQELNVYRSNWWIRSNFVGSDTMPIRHRPDFKEALSTLASPQECRGSSLLPKLVAKLFLVLVAMARFLVASLIWDITATMDLTLMERGNLRKSVNGLLTCGMSLTTNLVQKLQLQNSVTANAVYCHRRVV